MVTDELLAEESRRPPGSAARAPEAQRHLSGPEQSTDQGSGEARKGITSEVIRAGPARRRVRPPRGFSGKLRNGRRKEPQQLPSPAFTAAPGVSVPLSDWRGTPPPAAGPAEGRKDQSKGEGRGRARGEGLSVPGGEVRRRQESCGPLRRHWGRTHGGGSGSQAA